MRKYRAVWRPHKEMYEIQRQLFGFLWVFSDWRYNEKRAVQYMQEQCTPKPMIYWPEEPSP